jgi:hypothetical protein
MNKENKLNEKKANESAVIPFPTYIPIALKQRHNIEMKYNAKMSNVWNEYKRRNHFLLR